MAQGSVDDPLPLSLAQIQADDSNNIVAGNRNTTLGVTGTLLGLSFLIVVLRCWARQVILRTFGIDDAAMLLALGLAIVGFISFAGLCKAGGGRQANELSIQDQSNFKLFAVLIGICCVTGICLVKISVGFFLRRFLKTPLLRNVVYGFIGFIFVFMIYSIMTFVLICKPLASYWDVDIAGTCWSAKTMSIVGNLNAALNVTTDAFAWLLPVWVILKLQLNRKTKISLVIIMSLGLLSIVASIARVIFGSAWQWSTDLYLWLNIEVTVAIIAGSLPTLRPIFKSFLGTTHSPSSYPPNPSRPTNRSGYAKHEDGDDSIALESGIRFSRIHHKSSSNRNELALKISSSGTSFTRGFKDGSSSYNTHITSERAGCQSPGDAVLGDEGSEDGILALPLQSPDGIVKTTEIHVSET